MNWYGHVIRRDEEHIPRKVLRTDIPGKRKIGRPKTRWKDAYQRSRLEKYWARAGEETERAMWRRKICSYIYRRLYMMGKAWGKEEDANLEHSDLSHRYLLHHLVVFALQELLDCDELSRLLVFTLEHHAVASLANQPQVIILLHAATRGYDARASYLQV